MSWFKNITAYRLNNNISEKDVGELQSIPELLSSQIENCGWTHPNQFTENLYYKIGNSFFLRFQKNKKQIPSSLVKDMVKERVQELKEQGVDKVNNKAIKEDVISELAKNAFVKSTYIDMYIDNQNKLLIIDNSSSSTCDSVISSLRSFFDLKIDILSQDFNPTEIMTNWLSNKYADEPFGLENSCTLTQLNSNSQVTYKNQDLTDEEIEKNLSHGKLVSKLALNWHERINFILNNEFKISSLKATDVVEETLVDDLGDSDDPISYYEASMMLMVADFSELLTDLISKG